MMGPGGFGVGGPPVKGGGQPPAGLPQRPQTGLPLGPFSPPAARPGTQPQVSARLPQGSRFEPGSTVHGQVAGKTEGGFMLRLGEHMVKARTNLPLQVGEQVQFRVQGEEQGQLHLQVVKTPFSKLATSDLANTLSSMKLPVNEGTLELAKTMVEHGIPLTKENMDTMLKATKLPSEPGKPMPPLPARVAAVHFLQQNNLPVTPQNVATLSQFMDRNPQIGQQMFALNEGLQKLNRSTDSRALDMLKDMPGVGELMGELSGTNKGAQKPPSTPSKKLFNMARQTGIETNFTPYGGGEDPHDLLAELRQFRAELEGQAGSEELLALLQDVEGNLAAQQLINKAHPEDFLGFYYLQVPMLLDDGDTAEIWVKYYNEEDGSRTVDLNDTQVEFLVTTEHMGELSFILKLKNGTCSVELGTPSEAVRRFAARYLPVLGERLNQLGWVTGDLAAVYRPHKGKRELVERTDFDQLETCNVQA